MVEMNQYSTSSPPLNAPSLVYFDLIVHLGHHHCLSSGDLKLADKDVLDSYNDVVCLPSLTLSLI